MLSLGRGIEDDNQHLNFASLRTHITESHLEYMEFCNSMEIFVASSPCFVSCVHVTCLHSKRSSCDINIGTYL